jgi:soluble epoxide hydrolase/lipid-phosphate phosphatase
MENTQPDSFAYICYSSNPDLWKSDLCPVGKLQDWLQGGKTAPLPSWITKEELDEHRSILSKGGYTGPLNW